MRREIDILKQPIPTLLATFALLLTVQTLRARLAPTPAESIEGILSPLGVWIDTTLGNIGSLVAVILSAIISSVIITRIISCYSLSVVRSIVPMVLFVVSVCGVTFPIGSAAIMAVMLMVVHATDLMIMSFKRSERFSEVMRASFWTGLAALIVPDLVYVLALLPLQWLIWQRSPREMVAGAIMALLPLLPASFAWWVGGKEPLWFAEAWSQSITPLRAPSLGVLYDSVGALLPTILFGVLLLLTLVSILVTLGGFNSMRLRARKGHIYFITLYLVGLFMLLLGSEPAVALPLMGYASVPFIHTFFVRRKGALGVIIYIMVVVIALAAAILPTV